MRLNRRDDGFTLVELLITMVILGIIAFPLGDAVISYLHNTDATTARLGESHDAQIAAAYFAQDAASIGTRDWTTYPFILGQSVETGVAYDGGRFPCGTASTPIALVRFAWDDFASPLPALPAQVRVAYVVEPVAGQPYEELHRLTCDVPAGFTGTPAPISDVVLVHHIDASALPTVTCSTSCIGPSPAAPQYVSLRLTVKDPRDTDPTYVVTLTGQRRQT